MAVIYKYPVDINDEFTLLMPVDAQILTVQNQRGKPCMWALVHDTIAKHERTFFIIGTGNPIPEYCFPMKYIGTFQQFDGDLIWHLFEKEK